MGANIPRPPSIENVSTTLSSGITDVAGTMDVADASNIVEPCYLMIDRVDAAGELKASSLWELVKVTNIASNTLTITRGQNGTTGQAHSSGAVVEAIITSAHFEDWYDVLNPEHDSAGGHVITGTMTVAGMNLASVATIAELSAPNVKVNPVFSFIGSLSGPTTFVQSPLVVPHDATLEYVNVITRTVASGASAIIDINQNGTSIFDAGTRPSIAGGGTFVSSASIKTASLSEGDRLTWDYDTTGGLITDLNIQLRGY